MKNILRPFVIVLLFGLFIYTRANATGFGFYFGLSTPNDQINNVYNSSKLDNGVYDMFREGTKLGYHVGAKIRVGMSDNLFFVGGIAYHKFPQTTIDVKDPTRNDTVIATLQTSQNVIPITAGVNFFLIKQFIGLYAVGELTYNYVSSSVDYNQGSIPLSISKSPTDSRIGFGLGAGSDFDIKLITLNLEIKYNYINLIGQKAGEESKAFVSVSLGAIFWLYK